MQHSDFVRNKYYTWYASIIARALSENRIHHNRSGVNQYVEKHHIIPRSLGGKNTKDNLVLLTGKEHYVVHHLLTKFTIGTSRVKMLNAFVKMAFSRSPNQKRYTPNSFESARRAAALKNSISLKGKPKSEEWKAMMSKKARGRKMSDEFKMRCVERNKEMWQRGSFANKMPHSEETKQKIRDARANQIITEETKTKISEALKGKPRSEETKTKIREAHLARAKLKANQTHLPKTS